MRLSPIVLTAMLVLGAGRASAQFFSNDSQAIAGQFGVGTYTPRATLDVLTSPAEAYALWVSSQNGAPMLTIGASGQVGVGVAGPAALLDVKGRGDDGDIGAQLRSGNSTSTVLSGQIVFAYGSAGLYPHSLVTQAVAGQYVGNAIDFFLWNSTAQPSAPGTQEVLSVQGSISASSASVHVQPVGEPAYELVVSNGQTTGGGSVMAADVQTPSSRDFKTVVATLGDADADQAYADVVSLKPARFRYKRRDGRAGPFVRGLVYEDSPASIRDERGQSLSVEARLANMELALASARRRIAELEKKIAEAEKGDKR